MVYLSKRDLYRQQHHRGQGDELYGRQQEEDQQLPYYPQFNRFFIQHDATASAAMLEPETQHPMLCGFGLRCVLASCPALTLT